MSGLKTTHLNRKNPFTPTFGHQPYTFIGRDDLMDDVFEGLSDLPGEPNRATVFMGPRGSGKTVLVSTIAKEASQMGWVYAQAFSHEGLHKELMEQLEANASHLLTAPQNYDITSIQVGPVGLGREYRQHEEPSWRFRFQNVVEELNEQGIGVLFVIDEVNPDCKELIEFISTYQSFVIEGRDVALLLAGLPGNVSDLLIDKHVSFIRRAVQRRLVNISDDDIRDAAQTTITSYGKTIGEDALDSLVQAVGGFPYAMQLIGYHAWRYAEENREISMANVEKAIHRAGQEMEQTVVRPTLYECTAREIDYLQAMTQDEVTSTTSDIAQRLGISMTNASNLRRRLIDRGLIKNVRMGVVAFDMPIIEAYLRSHEGAWY